MEKKSSRKQLRQVLKKDEHSDLSDYYILSLVFNKIYFLY